MEDNKVKTEGRKRKHRRTSTKEKKKRKNTSITHELGWELVMRE